MIKLVKTINKKLLPTFVVVLVIILYGLTPWGRITFKSLALVAEFSPRVHLGILDLIGDKYTVDQVEVEALGGKIPADVYRPGNNRKNPAVIFLIGTRGLRTNDGVKRFANLFAKAGFVVLIPELDDLVQIDMRDTTIDKINALFDYLYTRDFVDSKKIGLSGVCAGATLSLIAAADSRLSDRVKFVNVVSPFFDGWDLTREVFTGQFKDEGRTEAWLTQEDPKEQLRLWYAGLAASTEEQNILKESILANGQIPDDKLETLSEDARSVFNFINTSSDTEFDRTREQLPQAVKVQVEAMTVRGKTERIKAKVYIIADSRDTYVAPVESKRLFESLPKKQAEFSYISSLNHVVPIRNLERLNLFQDALRIYFHIHSFLTYLDKK